MTTVFVRCWPMMVRLFRHALRVLVALVCSAIGVCAQPLSPGNVRGHIEQIAQAAQGRVGVAVTVLETGASVAVHGDERFPMQSVYKLPIGMAVLQHVDHGVLQLAQQIWVESNDFMAKGQHSPIRDQYPHGVALRVRDLLRFMVSESDGTACDVLLRLLGGPARVTAYVRTLGIHDIIVATTEHEMGRDAAAQERNWATPEAMVVLLRTLYEGQSLAAPSRALLLQLMTETPTGPHRLKGLLPPGTLVAHKTGSARTVDGLTQATNDVGFVPLPNGRHLAIAVFVADATADEVVRDGVIARITRAVWDAYGTIGVGVGVP